jgi:hypothetical protein
LNPDHPLTKRAIPVFPALTRSNRNFKNRGILVPVDATEPDAPLKRLGIHPGLLGKGV